MKIGDWIRTTNDNGLPVDLKWERDGDRDILVIDDEPFQRQYRLEVSPEDVDSLNSAWVKNQLE